MFALSASLVLNEFSGKGGFNLWFRLFGMFCQKTHCNRGKDLVCKGAIEIWICEMARVSPVEFIRQVRQEINKVTWPTRKETVVTTIMVFIMVFVCAAFFLVVDWGLRKAVHFILGMGA